ncbi:MULTISPECIES: LysR family transcriptional regulator [Streptomyces]|uniref:LysR family transcriptional regulator n=1 Tax=Streptomyces TaxID=1883 RepID=UPI00081BC278|nr:MULTISPECIES: LysR family transcriptional regulator [unclassified Streptomyces]MYQ52165.1 LysR family transcriptional regulator [Streptomyces sp. SID4941]SCD76712.1 DNA-binding transcriptional regulator, LysR family [Streptomyces sp. PalvLS-984]SDD29865.1 DNA-binding transcriptional regulator, LysR family [Streptomyces sp. AmelKG-A3]
MLNLERLRTLDALARHGSVSGAADGLHVTTSAVSQQMSKLEREVGQQLLARNGRGVRLTDAGRLLAGHAATILSQVALAQSDIEAQRGEVVGEVRLAAFPTAARGLFPAVLTALRADHPELRPRTAELEPEAGIRAVLRGDVDLAVVLDWSNKRLPVPGGLATARLLDDAPDIAMPAGHPLADRAEVGLEDFADDDWVSWPEGEFCHEWLMFTLRSKGIEPRIAHLAGEHHTQLALIAAGFGVCVAPRLGRGPVPDGVRLVPVRETMRRHVHAVWRTDADRRPSVRAAVDALRAAGRAVRGPAGAGPGAPAPRS